MIQTIGFEQFIAAKHEMLYQYEVARQYSKSRIVQASHGNVAEASFRAWLRNFLPMRFGICAGHIIPQRNRLPIARETFDVIIYDQMNSPTLWLENDADRSSQGNLRAIPAEHVYAVLEIKSAFSKEAAQDAANKLAKLQSLLAKVDEPSERYPTYLPGNFGHGVIFFELRDANDAQSALEKLDPLHDLRGFLGGMVLRHTEMPVEQTGQIMGFISDGQVESTRGLTVSGKMTEAGKVVGSMLMWQTSAFPMFAFKLLAWITGKYDGRLPTWHAMPTIGRRKRSTGEFVD